MSMNIVKYIEKGYGRCNNMKSMKREKYTKNDTADIDTDGDRDTFVPNTSTSNYNKRRRGYLPVVRYVELKDAIEKAGL